MGYVQHNKEEHNKAKDLVAKIEKSKDDKKKRELFEDLYVMIYSHHHAEEDVVFPRVQEKAEAEDDKELVKELKEEHSLISYQFSVVNRTGMENDTWDAKFSVLKEAVYHHMDEEEKEFSKVTKKVLTEKESEMLLEEFEKKMSEYEKEKKADLKN